MNLTKQQCKQWEWQPRGWFILLTLGGTFGLGFMTRSIRVNGIDIYLGPLCLTIQPPMPTNIEWETGGP